MKKIFILLPFLVILTGCGIYKQSIGLQFVQPIKNTSEIVIFEEVVNFQQSKEDLYTNLKLWFTENFKNANYVVQFDDKELGKLTGKGTYSHIPPVHFGSGPLKGEVSFIIDLSIKEDRYKIKVYNFNHKGTDYYSPELKTNVKAVNLGELLDCKFPNCTSEEKDYLLENWIQFHNDAYDFGTGIINSIKTRANLESSDDW